MTDFPGTQKIIRYGFFQVPNYSMIAFASAIEPLRMANRLAEKELYQWKILTLDGEPVTASNGLMITPNAAAETMNNLDALFVCSGVHVEQYADKATISFLQKAAQQKMILGSLCTGTYLLARAGLLKGYRSTIHWENLATMHEEYPQTIISSELFEMDRDRYTCSGGTAPMDMMLTLISQHHGGKLATVVSEEFICERIRGHNDRQRVPLRNQLGTSQPKLMEAVSLMESNIEEPISLDELARHVGISRRQLERLFQKHLQCVPTRYYLELRLTRARQLLLQTSKTIVDIALSCGFVSAPHFSKCYRDFFGIPPRDERRRKPVQTEAAPDAVVNPA